MFLDCPGCGTIIDTDKEDTYILGGDKYCYRCIPILKERLDEYEEGNMNSFDDYSIHVRNAVLAEGINL